MHQFLTWADKGQRVCTERAGRLYPRTTFSLCNIHLSFLVLLCPFNWFRVQRVCNGWAVLKPGCLGPELVKQHHPVLVVSKACIQTQLHNAHDQVLLLWHRGQGGADPSSPARRQLWLRGRPDPDFRMARRAQGSHYLWSAADASLGWSGAGTVDGNCQVGDFSPFATDDINTTCWSWPWHFEMCIFVSFYLTQVRGKKGRPCWQDWPGVCASGHGLSSFEIRIAFWIYLDYLLVLSGSFTRYNVGCLPLWRRLDEAAQDDVCQKSGGAGDLGRDSKQNSLWAPTCLHVLKLKCSNISIGERISWRILAKVVGASWESVEESWRRMVCWILSHLRRLRRHGGPRLPPLPRPRRLQGHRQPRREEEDVRVVPLGQGQLSEDKCSP